MSAFRRRSPVEIAIVEKGVQLTVRDPLVA